MVVFNCLQVDSEREAVKMLNSRILEFSKLFSTPLTCIPPASCMPKQRASLAIHNLWLMIIAAWGWGICVCICVVCAWSYKLLSVCRLTRLQNPAGCSRAHNTLAIDLLSPRIRIENESYAARRARLFV